MNNTELIVFIIYLAFMIGIGVYLFVKSKSTNEKDYFLGGRNMGPWVSALSAGASDMSAWVLMGLPASVYAAGMGQIWIAIGLAIGYALSWIFEAPRLRRFSIVANDSITIPQYLTNRFLSKSKALQLICAGIFLFAYTIYAASSIKACGTLFNTVIGLNANTAMYIAAFIIISYTFLGGFSAVCWTDFFQGLLMLGALLVAPIFAFALVESGSAGVAASPSVPDGYWNIFTSWSDVLSGLGWGLGYFGMPHIIIRFMSVRSDKDIKKSRVIGISWTVLILTFSVLAGIIGRLFLGDIEDSSIVFITMVRMIFPAVISGILLSAILAAAMSTADSQLLASASAFAADVYKPVFHKTGSDKEMLWAGRIVVVIIAVVALLVASAPGSGTIMSLVGNAWGVFGAAFGPVILLSLFWKRFTFGGAVAGIVVGAGVDILWLAFLSGTGLYEIIPGFIAGLLAAVLVSTLGKAPEAEVEALFDEAVSSTL
ncbi:MAG: sodium/proline symporter PutP [Clostridia bacterium]|nr:sodium/proline symporter PutP [Clostridia bacterium]NCC68688.1 sodium/proline symporter PutP [Clostridia bacterium]